MIFLTIGTHEPFDRLVRAVDVWCGEAAEDLAKTGQKLFGQITARGASSYQPQNFEWVAQLTPADYAARIAAADLIVSHAGMGSIITALHVGKPIAIMPRRGHLRETRNDHQYSTVKMLSGRTGIYVAQDETELGPVINRAIADLATPGSARIPGFADPHFTDALRSFILQSRS